MADLGASAAIVGLVAGCGELAGYTVRLISGKLSDATRRYWRITILGYFINLTAVPLLALAGNWQTAASLMVMERTGRAIRNPARDVMLSSVARSMGRGWAFGLHDALDQLGAMSGPLIIAGILYQGGDFRTCFSVLAISVFLGLSILAATRLAYPRPRIFEEGLPAKARAFPKKFWLYLVAASSVAVGYADFPLIGYHFERVASVPHLWIPILYAVAMGVSGLSGLIFGRWFDRRGLGILVLVTLLSLFFAPLVFLGNFSCALAGMALWGLGMGAQESVMRAAVAAMVPLGRRGYAYGMFNSIYGVFWFLGSAAMGFLYDHSVTAVVALSVFAQLFAIPVFWTVAKKI